jgi:hypothetical protein
MYKNKHNLPFDRPINFGVYKNNATEIDLCQDRLDEILKFISIKNPRIILDIGFYPGTIGRVIKYNFPDIEIHGIGKLNGASANDFPWYQSIKDAEFDKFYGQVNLPAYDSKFDLVIAGEIIEHILSPIEMLKFVNNYIDDSGTLFLTTPNVSSFGAVCRLLMGKSNYESLDSSIIYFSADWRPHVRLFDKNELIELGARNGLVAISHRYYLNKSIFHESRQGLAWILRIIFSIIPHLREDQMIYYEKSKCGK